MKISNGFALAAAVVMSPAAMAEVDLAWTGMGPYQEAFWSYDGTVNWDSPTRASGAYGLMGLSVFNGGEYEGYCWDVDAPVSEAPVAYEIVSYDSYGQETQDRFRFLASLYDQWYDEVKSTNDQEMGAALALITNEIMEENYDFVPGTWTLTDVQLQSSNTEGAIQFTGYNEDVQFHYDQMLASLGFGTDEMLDNLVIFQSVDGQWQDFVGYVPAPSALALLGLAGLAGRRRRNG